MEAVGEIITDEELTTPITLDEVDGGSDDASITSRMIRGTDWGTRMRAKTRRGGRSAFHGGREGGSERRRKREGG